MGWEGSYHLGGMKARWSCLMCGREGVVVDEVPSVLVRRVKISAKFLVCNCCALTLVCNWMPQ